MNTFRRFSIITTLMTYLLIFIGGLVRVAGAGMGCPDWPKCFDSWIPPTSLDQVPLEFQDQFNVVLAWIEYSNRLFGGLVGIAITINVFLAFKHYYYVKRIKFSVLAAFLLTLVEGWLGAILVDTILNPVTITLHLLLALIIVMLLLYASQEAYYLDYYESERSGNYPKNLEWLFRILIVSLLIEVMLGTEIRGGLEMMRKENPMIDSKFLLQMLGPFKYIHSILGFIITGIAGYFWVIFVKKSENPSKIILFATHGIMILMLAQIISGELLVFLEVIPLIQLFHLWIASWILGLVMIQYMAWKKTQVII